jgi:hypothetical protein
VQQQSAHVQYDAGQQPQGGNQATSFQSTMGNYNNHSLAGQHSIPITPIGPPSAGQAQVSYPQGR